jgi:NADPH2:quinone reductase
VGIAVLVINRISTDFAAAAMAFTQGRGVDKIVDSTGASILDRSFEVIRPLGHVIGYGEAEGPPFPNLWEQLVKKSLTFTRMHLGHMNYGSEDWMRGSKAVVSKIWMERLKPRLKGCTI